jgi:hypothetical protein
MTHPAQLPPATEAADHPIAAEPVKTIAPRSRSWLVRVLVGLVLAVVLGVVASIVVVVLAIGEFSEGVGRAEHLESMARACRSIDTIRTEALRLQDHPRAEANAAGRGFADLADRIASACEQRQGSTQQLFEARTEVCWTVDLIGERAHALARESDARMRQSGSHLRDLASSMRDRCVNKAWDVYSGEPPEWDRPQAAGAPAAAASATRP